MKNNRDILNEAFFKKASYEEKRAKSMPQYTPVDLKKSGTYSNSMSASPAPAYQVNDTDEVKKRLSGAFGVMFGNNNVRSMASRAIKEFPIVISDAVEPETAITIKKLVEEQYAEYINLLISNQVVNLADYSANDMEGNIAIQALDSISGSDFRRSRIADKAARSGNIDADTVFQNIPLYNLLRENQMELKSGDVITDNLLENAIVIPSSEVEKLIEFIDFNSEEIAELNEAIIKNREDYSDPWSRYGDKNSSKNKEQAKLNQYLMTNDKEKYSASDVDDIMYRDIVVDAKRGFQGLDATGNEIYSRLTTGDIVLDSKRFEQAINRSVGEMLTRPENVEIRDKFEKATFLLQSRRISGLEYYQYLTMRLGIPVSEAARIRLVKEFKIADVRKYGQGATEGEGRRGYVISKAEVKAIAQNRATTEKAIKMITDVKLKDIIKDAGITATGAATGAGIGGIAILLGSSFTALPIIGAAVGGGAFLLTRLFKRMKEGKQKAYNLQKIQGWERVEKLIEEMELHQAEVRHELQDKKYFSDVDPSEMRYYNKTSDYNKVKDHGENLSSNSINSLNSIKRKLEGHSRDIKDNDGNIIGREEYYAAKKDYLVAIEDTNKMIAKNLKESSILKEDVNTVSYSFREFFKFNKDLCKIFVESAAGIAFENQNDEHLKAEILTEKTLAKTSTPLTVKYVEKKDNKDIMVTPSFMARDTYAYGSTEIDRKALKDRRYNQPLIMTVRFKERFDDGKYSDNELTAVIGILGRIIRVPSSEMEYILNESANGKTVEGILQSNVKDTVADMFNVSKISKDLKNLPQSADIWRNLEKVATLAAANKISGRRNGNISNAHIVFSQKEVDAVRNETGIDFLKDIKKSIALMKRYSAFTVMIANDAGQRMSILDDQDAMSWNVIPYSALTGKDGGDQLNAALAKMMRL